MSYAHQTEEVTQLVANSLADAANVAGSRFYAGRQPRLVRSLWATITTVVSVAAVTVTWKYRPTPGSDTGAVTLGTLVLPNGTAAGKSVWKDVTPLKLMPGSELIVSFTGGGAGNASLGFASSPAWDVPENNANAIASA